MYNIKPKDVYLMAIIVLGLFTLCLCTTTALFTSSASTGNVINIETGIEYTFDINSNQVFTIDDGSIIVFDAIVSNSSGGAVYYELYYKMVNPTTIPSGLVVAEIGDTLHTSGNINSGSSNNVTVPIMITNNSGSQISVKVGVATGYVGNAITYSNGETKITTLADASTVPTTSCSGGMDLSECVLSGSTYVSQVGGVNHSFQDYTCSVDLGVVLEPFDNSGANAPVLPDGMIPVTWDGVQWVKADESNLTTSAYPWYNYDQKQWANAVMISPPLQRIRYENADPGYPITESHILAYYVWIPRYKYELFNVSSTTMDEQAINIIFESADTVKSTGSTNGSYLTHPAFTWGTGANTKELDGIWVGKFETTGFEGSPTILPNQDSINLVSLSSMYASAANFNSTTYLTETGVSTNDFHMMKNTEWGAVAYLAQSNYGLCTNGICSQIGVNNFYQSGYPSDTIQTGCGSVAGSSKLNGSCSTGSDYISALASTTENIYGIYDMSGGRFEYTMGVETSNNAINYNYSNFTTSTLPYSMCSANTYLNCYSGNRILGDATGETIGWYNNVSNTNYSGWMMRDCSSAVMNWIIDGGLAPGLFSWKSGDGTYTGIRELYGDSEDNAVSFRVVGIPLS
ncbi:MAG: hypothetical protein Q4G04_00680 [bacterium]|nr:hypothetical protein [bacterium]